MRLEAVVRLGLSVMSMRKSSAHRRLVAVARLGLSVMSLLKPSVHRPLEVEEQTTRQALTITHVSEMLCRLPEALSHRAWSVMSMLKSSVHRRMVAVMRLGSSGMILSQSSVRRRLGEAVHRAWPGMTLL